MKLFFIYNPPTFLLLLNSIIQSFFRYLSTSILIDYYFLINIKIIPKYYIYLKRPFDIPSHKYKCNSNLSILTPVSMTHRTL